LGSSTYGTDHFVLELDEDPELRAALAPALPKFNARRLGLASRVSSPFDIVGLGDSLFSGQATSSIAHRWPNRMVERLRALLPLPGVTGGVGYIPARWNSPPITNPWVWTGNVANSDNFGLSRQGKAIGADVGSGVGAGTITVTCSSVTLSIYRAGTDTFTIAIDGGAPAAIAAGPVGLWTWSSGALTPGQHTFTITRTAAVPVVNGIMVFNGDESAGIRYWDGAQSGSRADQFTNASGGSGTWADTLGTLVVPDLILVEWMTNDFTLRSPAQYQVNLANLLALLRTKAPTVPILWVAPYQKAGSGLNGAAWSEYVAAMKAVAATDTVDSDFINVGDYAPQASVIGLAGLADGTHPTDRFASYLGDLLAGYIVNRWAA
jgi:hypothetical protein